MWLLIAEALLALALLVGIVAWTMGAARRGREAPQPDELPAEGTGREDRARRRGPQ
jgi:hypothetical protein